MNLRRHDLVDVASEAWATAIGRMILPETAYACVDAWSSLRRPAMVRRRMAGDGSRDVPLAILLPNASRRLRLSLSVPLDAIAARDPVTLATAAVSAPPAWADTIDAALAMAPRFGMPTVYGGLLWQHVLGEPVLRDGSDLDLLWEPSPDDRPALIDALSRLDRGGPLRIDGEIVLEDGAGVAWRELATARDGRSATVVAKTLDGVALRDAGAILREGVPC